MMGMLILLLTIGCAGLIGWMSGALINYLADVLPTRRQITRLFCLACKATLAWQDYLLWPRACPVCREPRGIRSRLVLLVSAAAAVVMWLKPHPVLNFSLSILLYIFFGLVMVIDVEHRLILHPVSLVGAVVGAAAGIGLHGSASTFWGGVAGFGLMFVLYLLGDLFVRLLARWRKEAAPEDALGFGDVTLAGVIGLILGWPGIIAGLYLTIMLGGAVALLYITRMALTRRYQPFTAIAYGPCLVVATIMLLYGSVYLK